jgi:hypothetical protein
METPRPSEENDDQRELERLLFESRPVPRAAFRGELRRRLMASPRGVSRPERLRLLIAVHAGSGLALLAIAAIGLAGAGPLAAS